jgi:hypothetical protein
VGCSSTACIIGVEAAAHVHGATVPHWKFDRLVPHLRAAGFRIVRFDLFGHGLSDRPAVEYDFGLFLDQALELVDTLHATRPLTILGTLLGSFGAAVFTVVGALVAVGAVFGLVVAGMNGLETRVRGMSEAFERMEDRWSKSAHATELATIKLADYRDELEALAKTEAAFEAIANSSDEALMQQTEEQQNLAVGWAKTKDTIWQSLPTLEQASRGWVKLFVNLEEVGASLRDAVDPADKYAESMKKIAEETEKAAKAADALAEANIKLWQKESALSAPALEAMYGDGMFAPSVVDPDRQRELDAAARDQERELEAGRKAVEKRQAELFEATLGVGDAGFADAEAEIVGAVNEVRDQIEQLLKVDQELAREIANENLRVEAKVKYQARQDFRDDLANVMNAALSGSVGALGMSLMEALAPVAAANPIVAVIAAVFDLIASNQLAPLVRSILDAIFAFMDNLPESVGNILHSLIMAVIANLGTILGSVVGMIFALILEVEMALIETFLAFFASGEWVTQFVNAVVQAVEESAKRLVEMLRNPLDGMFRKGNDSDGEGRHHNRFLGIFGKKEKDVPSFDTGGVVARTGLAMVHKGERYSGVGRSLGGTQIGAINIYTNDTDNLASKFRQEQGVFGRNLRLDVLPSGRN